MKTINALSARSRLGTMLDEVSQEGTHYVIERLSQPLVAVVPFKEYQEIFQKKRDKDNAFDLVNSLAAFRKKYGKKLSGKKGVVRLVHELRRKRSAHLISIIK